MVGPLQKNSFCAHEKWKMVFSSKENENILMQHCLPSQDAPLCIIWDHLNKLCHECGHKIDHLAWTHESSHMIAHFLEHFLKIIVVLQVYYFFWKLCHIWWHNAKIFQFFDFFLNFLCPFQNAVKTAGITVPS